MLNNIYRNVELVQSEQWIISSTPRYNIKDAFYYQPCVTLPMINYIWILYYIISAPLHHQRCITSSTLYYIIKDALHRPRCILPSTQLYSTNLELHHQRWITSSIDATLHHQSCITSSKMLYVPNAALYRQCFITLSLLH